MNHLKRSVFAILFSVATLVGVGVCDAEVRRVPTVEIVDRDIKPDSVPLALASVPAGAPADAGLVVPPVPPAADIDPVTTAVQAVDALKAGKYVTAASLALILIVFALRKLGIAFFKTDRGGALLALIAGVATAFIGFEALGALTAKNVFLTLGAGVGIAAAGAGIRHLVINLIWPPDKTAPEVDL